MWCSMKLPSADVLGIQWLVWFSVTSRLHQFLAKRRVEDKRDRLANGVVRAHGWRTPLESALNHTAFAHGDALLAAPSLAERRMVANTPVPRGV